MPHLIALHLSGTTAVAVLPCRYVNVDGELFALHRQADPMPDAAVDAVLPARVPRAAGWCVTDPETGLCVGRGRTGPAAVAAAEATLAARGQMALAAVREAHLAS